MSIHGSEITAGVEGEFSLTSSSPEEDLRLPESTSTTSHTKKEFEGQIQPEVHTLFSLEDFNLHAQEIGRMHASLRDRGYAYIRWPEGMEEHVNKLHAVAKEFFSGKLDSKSRPGEINYSLGINIASRPRFLLRRIFSCWFRESPRTLHPANQDRDPNPREFLDILDVDVDHNNPYIDAYFLHSYTIMRKFAMDCLNQVLYPLAVNYHYVESILGPSNSKLRLIRYYYEAESRSMRNRQGVVRKEGSNVGIHSGPNNMDYRETCIRHTDMGLLSVAVCRDEGLQLLEFNKRDVDDYDYNHSTHNGRESGRKDENEPGKWVDVEAEAPFKPCLVIFAGETLSHLTGGYFEAAVHRVVTRRTRYSSLFFLRASDEALVDMTRLESTRLSEGVAAGALSFRRPVLQRDMNVQTRKQYRSPPVRPFPVKFN